MAHGEATSVTNGRSRLKTGLRLALALAVAAGAGIGGVSALAGHRLSRPRRSYGEGEPPEGSYEDVWFRSTDGLRISGWFLPAPEGVDGVVLCHGFHTGRREMLPLALALRERGHHALLFDFRGHGGSDGDRSSCGPLEAYDLEGAVRYLAARREMEGKRLGVAGFSMGAAVAISTAARVPDIDAVVSDSSFAIFKSVVETGFPIMYRLPAFPFAPLALGVAERLVGVCAEDNRPVDVISAIAPRPVLLIHGAADRMIPATEAFKLQAAAGDGAELWIVDGADHVGARFLDFRGYVDRVDRFLKTHLAPKAGR